LQKNEIRRPKLKVKRNGSQICFLKKNYSAKAFMIYFSLRCFSNFCFDPFIFKIIHFSTKLYFFSIVHHLTKHF
jgi:hypothetical protein